MWATRRAGATHTFPFLCSAAHCAAMLLSCFSLWSTLRVRGLCSCERFALRSSWRLLSPPRLLSIAKKVVASSSACKLKQVGKRALVTRQGVVVFRRAARETAKVWDRFWDHHRLHARPRRRAAGRPRDGADLHQSDFFCRPGRRSEAGRGAPPAAAAGPEPRAARKKSCARPARGCTGRRSGGGAARREKLARASRREGRRRAAALRRRGGAISGTRLPTGRARGAAGGAGAGGAARKPRGGEAEQRPHRGAPRAERPDFWGAATAGEKCGAGRRERGILQRRRGVFDSGVD